MTRISQRLFCAFAGLFGGCGIASYAAAAHLGGYYSSIAPLLLGNATALLAIALTKTNTVILRLSGSFMIIGVLLFTLDILARQYFGHKLFTFAAPIGGFFDIIGWFLLIVAAFISYNSVQDT